MARDRGLGHPKGVGQIADAQLPFGEQADYAEAGFIGEGLK
jgi:hypothetical protein